jgi:hypothetical protein
MDSLHRLRYVTARYHHLQGLRLIPLALLFLISAAWRDGLLRWVPGTAGEGARVWFLGLGVTALALSIAAGRYYRRRFGNVQPAAPFAGAFSFSVFAALLVLAFTYPDSADSLIPVPTLILAIAIGYAGLSGGRIRPHYLAVALLVAIFACLGVFSVPFHTRDVLLDQLTGVSLIVIGVGDHLLLRRTLVPVSHVDAV